MLAKLNRLSKKDIDALFKQSDSFRTPLIYVRIRRTKEPRARFCILFSKNNKLTNTDRNRVRRQTYAQIEKVLKNFEPYRDYGIMLTPKLLDLTKEQRMEAIRSLLTKITSDHV